MINADKISCGYGGGNVLTDISLTVSPGDSIALAGENGCGKTTLLRALCGMVTPTAGGVFLDGKNVAEIPPKELAKSVAMLSQTGAGGDYFEYTVRDAVMMGRYARQKGGTSKEDIDAVARCIAEVGLAGLEEKNITELSGGQLQRVLLARAFAQEPQVLLLDEPANHLDIRSRVELAELIRRFTRRGGAVVGVYHDLGYAAMVSQKMLLMKDGRALFWGETAEALRSEMLSEAFETDVRGYMRRAAEPWL